MGGGPLNKGVIQLLYAGTGRESRTISGPRVAAERDHLESASFEFCQWGDLHSRERREVEFTTGLASLSCIK